MPRPLRVFLCHASQDKPAVRKLHRYLKQHGIQPWLDQEDLLPGENWEVEIPRALNASDVILVCLSKNSVNKEGYVQKEVSFALDKALEKPDGTIFIIPAKLEDCDVPKRLNRFQWVDLFRPDSNKRLLLGLNKRALDLGSDVLPVILEDTRQRKPAAIKPLADSAQLDREAVEKAEKAAQAKLEQEAAERAEIARLAQEAKERSAREEAEKIAQAKLEKEAAEQVEIARLAQEAKEKLERETAERVRREKLESARKATIEKEKREAKRKKQREFIAVNSRWYGMGGIVLIMLILGGFGLTYLVNKISVATIIPNIQTPELTNSVTTQMTKDLEVTATLGSTTIGRDGMTLHFVPVGLSIMGSDVFGHVDENPQHHVNLSAFWIDETEVTNQEYALCVKAGVCSEPHEMTNYLNKDYAYHPVVFVSWYDANSYCSWVGRRLPSEAEWEKAARGLKGNNYPWGNAAPQDFRINFNNNTGTTSAVNTHPYGVSGYGVLDMAGNVWEWVSSLYQPYPYEADDGREDLNYPGQRVLRGGSWNDSTVSSTFRFRLDPDKFSSSIGFRCALSQ